MTESEAKKGREKGRYRQKEIEGERGTKRDIGQTNRQTGT